VRRLVVGRLPINDARSQDELLSRIFTGEPSADYQMAIVAVTVSWVVGESGHEVDHRCGTQWGAASDPLVGKSHGHRFPAFCIDDNLHHDPLRFS
jgi:hypothetical protein